MSRLVFVALGLALAGCSSAPSTPEPAQPALVSTPVPEAPPGAFDLQVTDVKVGGGAVAQSGQRLTVSYVGKLKDGTTFDSSGGKPFVFTLGGGQVIKGWDQGLVGMKVGGRRKLVIPPDLAYGATGAPPKIPPSATLTFDISLMKVE